MPLPWKKPKVGRISRLVADLQQSPKRGGSLVVETGFPTSLIDLFVKNRDRLKKPSKRRHLAPPSPSPSHSPPPRPPPLLASSRSPPEEQEAVGGDDNNEIVVVKEVVAANEGTRDAGAGDTEPADIRDRCFGGGTGVFMAVLKVFVVVVLALSTKKLTVGITLSAFALLFLEIAAARVLHACNRLDFFTTRSFRKRNQESNAAEIADCCEITEVSKDLKNLTDKVTVRDVISCPEPELVLIPEKIRESANIEGKGRVIEEEEQRETIRDLICKPERSKSSKLKSKIVKKIIPKKFRKMKSKKNKETTDQEDSISEASSIISDDKSEKTEEEIPEKQEDWQSSLTELCIEEEEEEFHVGVDDSETNVEMESKGNKGCMILVLIVLAGLLGGRVLAIGLTMVCCLVPRLKRNLKERIQRKGV